MMKLTQLLLFPFVALARLFALLVLPAAVTLLVWLIFDTGPVLTVAVVVCGAFALAMVSLWQRQMTGLLRSLSRGSVRIRGGRKGES